MSQTKSISNIENKVFRVATFEDGIWEIYLGLFFAMMSVFSVTRNLLGPAVNALVVISISIALVGVVWLIKKNQILPRTGSVKFGAGIKKKLKIAHIITWLLVILTLTLAILASKNLLNEPTWNKLPQWVTDFDIDLVFALIFFAIFSIVAYQMELPRFYLYGFLIAVGNFSSTVMLVYGGKLFQWPLAVAGGIIIVIGIVVLIRFMKKHPIPEEEING